MADGTTGLPDRDGDSVRSSTGQATPYILPVIDDMRADNIRGQSPISGLMHGDAMCDSDWEDTVIPPYQGETQSDNTGGGMVTGIGTWPIQNYSNSPKQHTPPSDGPSDWTGHKPGDLPG